MTSASGILQLYRFRVSIGDMDPILTPEDEAEIESLESQGIFHDPQGFFDCIEVEQKPSDWLREPVAPRQFITDPYYAGPSASALYPILQDEFVDIFAENYHEVILAGSISWGKTYLMAWCMFRQLYELSCVLNPQQHLGIAPNTPIVMANISVTGAQAKNACFNYVQKLVDNSPYFKEHFQRDKKLDAVLKFPHNVTYLPGNSSEFSVIGANLIAGAVDEANFLVSAKKMAHEKMQAQDIDHAKILYRALARRIELRFRASKGWKGRLFLCSSRIYDGDFIDQQIKAKQGKPGIKICDKSHWEVFGWRPNTETRHPHTKEILYSGKWFQVAIGHSGESSRILASEETIPINEVGQVVGTGNLAPDTEVLVVPKEYYETFAGDDLEGAIRDVGGKGTLSVNPWIANRKAIQDQVRDVYAGHPLRHPFPGDTKTGLIVAEGMANQLDLRILCQDRIEVLGRGSRLERVTTLRPRRAPEMARYAHFDLAYKNDAAGFAMGYVAGYTSTKIRAQGSVYVEVREVPIIVFELLCSFIAPIGGEIEFGYLRDVLYRLRDVGNFFFASVTFDQYQSVDSKQILAAKGFTVDELSVDRDIGPYSTIRNGITEGWIHYYQHEAALRELRKLQRVVLGGNTKRIKVDHPEFDPDNPRGGKGSKDVSDAMAAVCAKILEAHEGQVGAPAPSRGFTETPLPQTGKQWTDPNSNWLVAEFIRAGAEKQMKKREEELAKRGKRQ